MLNKCPFLLDKNIALKFIPITVYGHGGIAQQVEQRPEKPCVPSSTLGPATIFARPWSGFFYLTTNKAI